MLFPAQISEDSPWKQETATSRLDPETENKTQEAIDLYFSQHHKVTSPENDTTAGISQIVAINERSVAAMDESVLGGSPGMVTNSNIFFCYGLNTHKIILEDILKATGKLGRQPHKGHLPS